MKGQWGLIVIFLLVLGFAISIFLARSSQSKITATFTNVSIQINYQSASQQCFGSSVYRPGFSANTNTTISYNFTLIDSCNGIHYANRIYLNDPGFNYSVSFPPANYPVSSIGNRVAVNMTIRIPLNVTTKILHIYVNAS